MQEAANGRESPEHRLCSALKELAQGQRACTLITIGATKDQCRELAASWPETGPEFHIVSVASCDPAWQRHRLSSRAVLTNWGTLDALSQGLGQSIQCSPVGEDCA